MERRAAWVVVGALAAAWLGVGAAVLVHRVFVSNDSISNYGHVWFVSQEIWEGRGLPYRFPEIGHGEALAFPYAFVPWTTAALLHPVMGDRVVTLWLVIGAAGVIGGTWWALPELRRPWAFAGVLANPMLVEALILSQLPFLWATAFLFGAVGAWRRGWYWQAALVMGLAQGSHPAVVLPLASLLVLAWLRFEERKRLLVGWYAVSVALSLPGVAMVFLSPVVEDSGLASALSNFVGTVGARLPVVFIPILLAWMVKAKPRWLPAMAAAGLALCVALVPVRDTTYAWGALVREPDEALLPFLGSSEFEPGATYRVLRSRDGKVGMYQVLTHGGRLDSEFFPESFARRSWDTVEDYRSFLRKRKVDFVLIARLYDERERTNEHVLLERLVSEGCATKVTHLAAGDGADVYRVRECR
jgi:hypothetical protein